MNKNLNLKTNFSVISAIFFFLSAFAPLDYYSYQYNWKPSFQSSESRISLSNPTPKNIEITFSCENLSSQPEWIFEAFGGPAFQISASNKKAFVTLGSRTRTNEITTLDFKLSQTMSDSCVARLSFDRNSNKFIFMQSEIILNKEIPKDFVVEIGSFIVWNETQISTESEVNIYTAPISDVKISKIKILFLTLGFLFLFLYFRTFFKLNKFSKFILATRIKKSEFFTIIYAVFLGLFSLPRGDDGWYMLMARTFQETGFFDNYAFAAARPTGQLHIWLQSLFLTQYPLILTLRLPAIISIVTIWVILRRSWLRGAPPSLIILCWSVWALVSTASMITIRPEPLVALATALAVAILYFERLALPSQISAMILFSGLGLALHQSGLIPLIGTLVLTFYLFASKKLKFSNFKPFDFLIISSSGALLFAFSNPLWALRAAEDFESAANRTIKNNNLPFYMEWKRLEHLFFSDISTSSQILFGILTFGSYIFISWLFFKKNHIKLMPKDLNFVIFSLAAPFGLFFSPIKWSWYYAVLMPIVIINFFIIKKYQLFLFTKTINYFIFIIFFALTSAILFFLPWRSNDILVDFQESKSINFAMGNYDLVLYVLIIVLTFSLIKKMLFGNIETLIIITIAFFVFFHITPPIAAAFEEEGWSFVKHSVKGLYSKDDRCGILNKSNNQILLNAKPGLNMPDREIILMPELYIFVPCEKPVALKDGRWGSPEFSYGWIPVYDQQRIAVAFDISEQTCLSSLYGTSTSCFFEWTKKIDDIPEPLVSIKTTW